MPAVARGLERAAVSRRAERVTAMRRWLWRLLVVLDRFVPPRHEMSHDPELLAEWFKYPPI
jgi:hypothetical protein